MADDFNFKAIASPSGQVSFRTRTAQFGDGYSQAAGDGINTKSGVWNITVVGVKNPECGNLVDIDSVVQFLDETGGWQSFTWTPPGGNQARFTASSYSLSKNGSVYTLSATFTEVFRLSSQTFRD